MGSRYIMKAYKRLEHRVMTVIAGRLGHNGSSTETQEMTLSSFKIHISMPLKQAIL